MKTSATVTMLPVRRIDDIPAAQRPLVKQLRRRAKIYAMEGRGCYYTQVDENGSWHITNGIQSIASFQSKHDASAVLRAGSFCEVSANLWRPRYEEAPWLAKNIDLRAGDSSTPYTV